MKKVLVSILAICWLGLVSCSVDKSLDISLIKNSDWLFHDFGDCEDIYSFQDSTFENNSCEIGDVFEGSFWAESDTLFLLIPYPEKIQTLIGGDSVEVYVQGGRTYRPTLEKFIYRNDTLFFAETYHSYGMPTQRKFIGSGEGYITRMTK